MSAAGASGNTRPLAGLLLELLRAGQPLELWVAAGRDARLDVRLSPRVEDRLRRLLIADCVGALGGCGDADEEGAADG